MIHSNFALARILFLAMPGAQWGQGKSSWARNLGDLATCRAAELIAEGDPHTSVDLTEHICMSLDDQAGKNLGKDPEQNATSRNPHRREARGSKREERGRR